MHTANFLFATIFVLAGNVKAASLPDAIIQQFPSDHAALTYKEGDFNSDNKLDFVVVLRHKDEDKMIEQNLDTPPRPLLVFIQKNRNDYILVARNDNVVYTINEGGQCDQFMSNDEGLAVKVLFFTVQNSVACGHHWTDYITFKYSPAQQSFFPQKSCRRMENRHSKYIDNRSLAALQTQCDSSPQRQPSYASKFQAITIENL